MTSTSERPKVAWHLPSVGAEWRWTIAVLLLPQLAAMIVIVFFARGLAYRPVPVAVVNAAVLFNDPRDYSGAHDRPLPSYELAGEFSVQSSGKLVPGSRFTTSDWMFRANWFTGALGREVARFNASETAYISATTGEVLLFRGMHPVGLPLVLLAFAVTAGACESWTRILHLSEPPSRRKQKTLRASTTPLLTLWFSTGFLLAGVLYFLPEYLGFYFPLWISLPLLVGLDIGSVVMWMQGRLPPWTKG